MPTFNKNWKGQYPGNYLGNIWQSWNIDLEDSLGRVKLSNRMATLTTGLGVVYKFLRTNATATDQWFGIVHNADIIRNGNPTISAGTWITDDTTGTFNDPRDMVIHEFANGEQRLLCSRATNIAILNKTGGANVWDDDWWTTVATGPALTSLDFHPMARLQRLVAVGDKQTNVPVIHTLSSADAVTTSKLSFGAEYTVRNIMVSSNRFWIGLQHDFEGPAKIIEWDGSSDTYNNEYELPGSYPLVGFVAKDIPYFITERGFIMKYTGGGFERVQSFNLDERDLVFTSTITNEDTINNYGATVDQEIVYLNVGMPIRVGTAETAVSGGVRRGRSGVWIFNTKNLNLYHHMSFGEYATSGTDRGFANSPVTEVGAIVKPTIGGVPRLVASAEIYTGGSSWLNTTSTGIFREVGINATNPNRGGFITPYIPIGEVEAFWEALVVKFKRFIDSGNRIVVKWRVVDPIKDVDEVADIYSPLQAIGTWASTTTFTSVVPTGVAVGDEVEVMTGDNGGCLFNISTLSATPDGSTTITVTISEAAPVSSTDKSLFRFDNFKTETAISSTSVGNQRVPFTSTAHGEFIQLKIEMRGMGMEIDELLPIYKVKTAQKQS